MTSVGKGPGMDSGGEGGPTLELGPGIKEIPPLMEQPG